MKKNTALLIIVFFVLLIYLILPQDSPRNTLIQSQTTSPETLWEYQCIDTMKTSRDKARAWKDREDLDDHINWEMDSIVDMGGNCVALDTPYDEEFKPVLQKWVNSARTHNLKVWYRGNFSSWEGWFEYPKGMTTEEHNKKTFEFIVKNPELFKDGDIFTPSPEAENGGPFNQVEKDEHEVFRTYLISEYQNAKKAFAEIDKDVKVNWLSMNGGFAKRMFDQPTLDKLDRVVSLDHYIKTSPEMGEYINYFYDTFKTKSVIGEFGAPIPDINGKMTEKEQAAFTDELFYELYKHKDKVIGLNYWTLYDGSTALYNQDLSPRPAVDVIRNYFKPMIVDGKIVNDLDENLSGAVIETEDKISKTTADESGHFKLLLPSKKVNLVITHPNLSEEKVSVTPNDKRKVSLEVKLYQNSPSIIYQLKKFYNQHLNFF